MRGVVGDKCERERVSKPQNWSWVERAEGWDSQRENRVRKSKSEGEREKQKTEERARDLRGREKEEERVHGRELVRVSGGCHWESKSKPHTALRSTKVSLTTILRMKLECQKGFRFDLPQPVH